MQMQTKQNSSAQAHAPVPLGRHARGRKGMLMLHHLVNYIGVAIASKLVPVASIFLYSHLMSVYDYGILNLSASYLWIFGIVMTLNLHTGIGRYVYTEEADYAGFLGTTFVAVGTIYGVITAGILLNLDHFARWMSLPREVVMLMLLVVTGAIAESILTQISIHRQDSNRLVRYIFVKAGATLSLSVGLLMLVDTQKYLAVLYADAAISVCFMLWVLFRLRGDTRMCFDWRHLKYMGNYAVPMIPYMLSLTLLSQFDRVMIDRFFGKETTGLYSLSYNVGVLMLMVVTALLNVFTPSFFAAVNSRDYGRVLREADGVFALGVVATVFLVLFGEDVFRAIVPAKYDSALDLIPVVAIAGLCQVVFQLWARLVAYANKTYFLSVIATIATVVKICLNLVVLPVFGYKSAAATTVLGYLLMSLLCVWVVNTQVALFKVPLRRHLGYIGASVGLLLFFAVAPLPFWLMLTLKAAVLVATGLHFKAQILALLLARSAPAK
jgi:O-antigen/teichoic acid export membrane protein